MKEHRCWEEKGWGVHGRRRRGSEEKEGILVCDHPLVPSKQLARFEQTLDLCVDPHLVRSMAGCLHLVDGIISPFLSRDLTKHVLALYT